MGQNLKARVHQHPAATTVDAVLPHAVPAPETKPDGEPLPEKTLEEHIRDHQQMFADAMPKGTDADQLIQDALIALRKVRNLDRCDHHSMLGAMMTAAQLGLRIGVLGHSWLEAIWQRRYARNQRGKWVGHHRARLIIGYQGLRELTMRSPKVLDVNGRVRYARDEFEVVYGTEDRLAHTPCGDGLPGDSTHYYAIVRYINGGRAFEVVNRAQAEEHRDLYATSRRRDPKTGEWVVVGAWASHFDDMAVKTAFRRLSRWLPKTTELDSALTVDGTVRVDLTPEGILHTERPDALDQHTPGAEHDAGHGETLAWAPDCEECVDDATGQAHFLDHVKPADGCAYCERETAWRGVPDVSTS